MTFIHVWYSRILAFESYHVALHLLNFFDGIAIISDTLGAALLDNAGGGLVLDHISGAT